MQHNHNFVSTNPKFSSPFFTKDWYFLNLLIKRINFKLLHIICLASSFCKFGVYSTDSYNSVDLRKASLNFNKICFTLEMKMTKLDLLCFLSSKLFKILLKILKYFSITCRILSIWNSYISSVLILNNNQSNILK